MGWEGISKKEFPVNLETYGIYVNYIQQKSKKVLTPFQYGLMYIIKKYKLKKWHTLRIGNS